MSSETTSSFCRISKSPPPDITCPSFIQKNSGKGSPAMAQESRACWPREAVDDLVLVMNQGWTPSWGSVIHIHFNYFINIKRLWQYPFADLTILLCSLYLVQSEKLQSEHLRLHSTPHRCMCLCPQETLPVWREYTDSLSSQSGNPRTLGSLFHYAARLPQGQDFLHTKHTCKWLSIFGLETMNGGQWDKIKNNQQQRVPERLTSHAAHALFESHFVESY